MVLASHTKKHNDSGHSIAHMSNHDELTSTDGNRDRIGVLKKLPVRPWLVPCSANVENQRVWRTDHLTQIIPTVPSIQLDRIILITLSANPD
jgi:hypothetical protein